MTVAERRVSATLESSKAVAEPRIAVTVGMLCPVFLPEQRQRHTFALHLGRNGAPIRFDEILWRAANAAEQMAFQRGIVIQARR